MPSPASATPLVLVLVLVLVIELRTANSRCHHARRQNDIKARHSISASLFNRRVCATRHVRRCRAPIDYEHEHRCAEHEHESIGVTHNGNDLPAPERLKSPGRDERFSIVKTPDFATRVHFFVMCRFRSERKVARNGQRENRFPICPDFRDQ